MRLLHGCECPAVAGELARDGDRDDRAPLAAAFERVPACVQPARALVGAGADRGGLSLVGAAQALRFRAAVAAGARRPRPAAVRACVLPVLVIAPSRRRSPVESSLGVSPRNGPSDCGRKRCPVAELDGRRERGQRRDATQTDRAGRRSRQTAASRRAPRSLRRARPAAPSPAARPHSDSSKANASGRDVEALPAQPGVMRERPRARVVDEPVPQEAASRAGGGRASARRARPRGPARDHGLPPRAAPEPAPRPTRQGASRPGKPLRVATISLDPISRRPRDLRRRRHRAGDPRLARTRARARTRSGPPHRRPAPAPAAGAATRPSPRTVGARRPAARHSPIEHARDDLPRVHIQPDPATFSHIRRLP